MNTDKIIEERFHTVSKTLQQIMTQQKWRAKVQEIASHYTLDEVRSHSLEVEVLLLLTLLEDKENLESNLTHHLELERTQAKEIADVIIAKILTPVSRAVALKEVGNTPLPTQQRPPREYTSALTHNETPAPSSPPTSDPYREPIE